MENAGQFIGVSALVILAVIGLLAGGIASFLTGGRHRVAYMLLGVVGAVGLPLILSALGFIAVAAAGLLALLVMAVIGAAILLVLGRLIFR